MHRYLPLTAVLLAFWIGRTTGADNGGGALSDRDRLIHECLTASLDEQSSQQIAVCFSSFSIKSDFSRGGKISA